MSGLAGAVTGKSMRELWVEEIAEPLGTDELSLGAPPKSSDMVVAEFVDPFLVGELALRDSLLSAVSKLPISLGAMAGACMSDGAAPTCSRATTRRCSTRRCPPPTVWHRRAPWRGSMRRWPPTALSTASGSCPRRRCVPSRRRAACVSTARWAS